jgi:hypothetical protein
VAAQSGGELDGQDYPGRGPHGREHGGGQPVPPIQQSSRVTSGIAAPMRIGSSRSIVASSPRTVSLPPDRSSSPARSA